MDWLKTHEYLAVWLNLPLMLVIAIYQQYYGETEKINVSQMAIYLAFFTCLAVMFTPGFDSTARGAAMGISALLIWKVIGVWK